MKKRWSEKELLEALEVESVKDLYEKELNKCIQDCISMTKEQIIARIESIEENQKELQWYDLRLQLDILKAALELWEEFEE